MLTGRIRDVLFFFLSVVNVIHLKTGRPLKSAPLLSLIKTYDFRVFVADKIKKIFFHTQTLNKVLIFSREFRKE